MTALDGITVVTEPSREYLNQRQLVDYRSKRESGLTWLLTFEKAPDQVEGYARTTVTVSISTSLDGFDARPNDSPENAPRDSGEGLHEWIYDWRAGARSTTSREVRRTTTTRSSRS
ncbi:hypothetical protein ACFQO4_00660 [Saliphagus sp. GCM10025334]